MLLEEARTRPRKPDLSRIPLPVPAHSPGWGRRRAVLLALLVGALAAALRLWGLDSVGFNSDEAVYAGQAASIAGDSEITRYFPVFRAHPMLFQTALSLLYQGGVSDFAGRVLSALVGVGTVGLAYLVGKLFYGRRAGFVAALFMAVMPYHVVVTRQVLLDGPMTFFVTLTLYLVARFAHSGQRAWLWAAGGAMGLSFLAKEPSIVYLGAIYAFFALAPQVRVRLMDLAISFAGFFLVALPYPLSVYFAGRTHTGQAFLAWQLFRRPNHTWSFYPTTVPQVIGLGVVVAAVAGLWWLRRERSWRETLLLSWVAVPAAFFQLWPVKGFQYLLPLAVPAALLAARALVRLPGSVDMARFLRGRAASGRVAISSLAVALVAVTLAVPAWGRIQPSNTGKFLAGSGGVPGGREAGEWVKEHVPEGARILALGPSMANITQFYGQRKVYGLSVSPNPLHRNPTYEALANPDLLIRRNDLQYIVWDSFSASRSQFFSDRLLRYVERYHGREVHRETVPVTSGGETTDKPVILIYEVRP